MGIGCEASLQTGLSIPSLSALLVRLGPAGSFTQRGGRRLRPATRRRRRTSRSTSPVLPVVSIHRVRTLQLCF
jgi:hypothetical protein